MKEPRGEFGGSGGTIWNRCLTRGGIVDDGVPGCQARSRKIRGFNKTETECLVTPSRESGRVAAGNANYGVEQQAGRKECRYFIARRSGLVSKVGWEIRAMSWHAWAMFGRSESGEDVGSGSSRSSSQQI